MLTRLEALRFGCLRHIDQDLGGTHLLVGPSGSGKSTVLDAVAFISDLVSDGLDAAIDRRTPDLRDLVWQRRPERFELAVEVRIPQEKALLFPEHDRKRCRYEVAVGLDPDTGESAILSERVLLLPDQPREKPEAVQASLFPSDREAPESLATQRTRGLRTVIHKVPGGNDKFYDETGTGWDHSFKLGPRRSTLANLPDDEQRFPVSSWLKELLGRGVRRLAPCTERMRFPCPPGRPRAYQPDGSNLPWLVADLSQRNREGLARWERLLADILPGFRGIRSVERPEDRHRFVVVSLESGLDVPSWLLPLSTLRVLALTVPVALAHDPGVLLVEEPETGLTPSAAASVYTALRGASGQQVIVTTQCPEVVRTADPADVLCLGLTATGATDIVAGPEHEGLAAWREALGDAPLAAREVLG
jgi:predicted ATPase